MVGSLLPAVPTNNLLKHTAVIHVSNTLTLLQRKASNVLLKYALPRLSDDITHTIPLSTVAQELGWAESSNSNDELQNALRTLNTTQIEWNILGKDKRKKGWGVTTILSGAEIIDGKLHYRYDKGMREILASPTIYARLDMEIQKSFRSKHSLALWEFFVEALCSSREREIDTGYIELTNLRKLLAAVEEYYDNFKKLNQKILKPALQEINTVSDLLVSVDYKKDKKRVIALTFHIKRKDSYQLSLGLAGDKEHSEDPADTPVERNQQHVLREEFGISARQATALLKKYPSEDIDKAITCVREQNKQGKIENLAAFTVSAIKEGWELPAVQPGTAELADIDAKEAGIQPAEWKEVRSIVRRELGDAAFRNWIAPLICNELSEDSVELGAPSGFSKGWIETKFEDVLKCAWIQVCGHAIQVKLELATQKTSQKAA